MANSTTNIDGIIPSQANKEATANAFFDAASQAATYGRRASTSSGLTWGYYGGNVVRTSDGATVQIANGTLTLTPSSTNYIVAEQATGAVSSSTSDTNWNNTADYWRLYSVVTGSATVTSWTDVRAPAQYQGGGSGGGGGGMTNPMTDENDLIVGGAGGLPTRLPVGTEGQVLKVVSGDIAWAAESGGGGGGTVDTIVAGDGILVDATDPANPVVSADFGTTSGTVCEGDDSRLSDAREWADYPLTTAEDLLVGGTSGAPSRLPVGTEGQVLTVSSGAVAWANPTSGFANPMTTAGDLIYGGVGGAAQRLPVGTDGQVLKVVAGNPAWAADAVDAEDVAYNNTASGLAATDVQDAIDELAGEKADTASLGTAAFADILGTVSQSGGVPTGAIIERGSNANGDYVRYADGTMLCRLRIDTTPNANLVTSYAFSFPAMFAGGGSADISLVATPVSSQPETQVKSWAAIVTSTGGTFYMYRTNSTETYFMCIALGRWF